jgi:23S rRNA (cytidine2498-2'-O)-methyltransferase
VGAETTLKKELLRDYPEFKFAFSRPGFITFKRSEKPVPFEFSLRSVFTRAYGVSFGTVEASQASKIIELALSIKTQDPQRKLRLHVWERDLHAPSEEPMDFTPGALLGNIEAQLRKEAQWENSPLFEPAPVALDGDWVIHVIAIDPNRFAFGVSIHSAAHSPYPGGHPEIQLPADAPSRAYLKLEESLLWSRAPIRAGDIAVEIGSAPGGASYALLKKGLKVVGIDPGKMDPRILANRNFIHIQKPVALIPREELPDSIQWLLLDMNVEPRISLYAVDRLGTRMRDSLLGVLLTVKLNQWKFADEIPSMVEHLKAMGMSRVRVAQLSYNRQEIVIYGLTRKGASLNKN